LPSPLQCSPTPATGRSESFGTAAELRQQQPRRLALAAIAREPHTTQQFVASAGLKVDLQRAFPEDFQNAAITLCGEQVQPRLSELIGKRTSGHAAVFAYSHSAHRRRRALQQFRDCLARSDVRPTFTRVDAIDRRSRSWSPGGSLPRFVPPYCRIEADIGRRSNSTPPITANTASHAYMSNERRRNNGMLAVRVAKTASDSKTAGTRR
jgi:hypothetical protein